MPDQTHTTLYTPDFQVRNGRNKYHLIPYIGNKSGFAHIFADLIPDLGGKKIYDVFGGGASFTIYCCYRFGSQNVTYNDNNPIISNFLRWVKNNPKGLLQEYAIHKKRSTSQYYLDVRDKTLDDGLKGAGRFLYLAKNAFSGKIRFNGSNKFNAPMRKRSKCPNLEAESLARISKVIKDLTITNESFEYYRDEKEGFLYLDPPYMGNPNNHYNGVPELEDFLKFVKKVERSNMVMISEQNDPAKLNLSQSFYVYSILLNRSLQYTTQNNSKEIIAINYSVTTKPLGSNQFRSN